MASFNNISDISGRSGLLLEDTGVLGEKKPTDLPQVTVVSSTPGHEQVSHSQV